MHNCMTGCIVQCSNIVHDKDGKYVTSALEFETMTLLGANCAIGSWEDVADLDRLCDELGLDTIETGAAIAMLHGLGRHGVRRRGRREALLHEIAEGRRSSAERSATARRGRQDSASTTRAHGEGPGDPGVGSAPAEGDGITYARARWAPTTRPA